MVENVKVAPWREDIACHGKKCWPRTAHKHASALRSRASKSFEKLL